MNPTFNCLNSGEGNISSVISVSRYYVCRYYVDTFSPISLLPKNNTTPSISFSACFLSAHNYS